MVSIRAKTLAKSDAQLQTPTILRTSMEQPNNRQPDFTVIIASSRRVQVTEGNEIVYNQREVRE